MINTKTETLRRIRNLLKLLKKNIRVGFDGSYEIVTYTYPIHEIKTCDGCRNRELTSFYTDIIPHYQFGKVKMP